MDMSFICWGRVIRVPCCFFFLESLQCLMGMLKGLGVLVAGEVVVAEDKGAGNTTIRGTLRCIFLELSCLGLLSSVAKVSEFLEYEHPG
jgi:hypothetical protein